MPAHWYPTMCGCRPGGPAARCSVSPPSMLIAWTSISTSVAVTAGSGTSSYRSTSGPPGRWMTAAFMSCLPDEFPRVDDRVACAALGVEEAEQLPHRRHVDPVAQERALPLHRHQI